MSNRTNNIAVSVTLAMFAIVGGLVIAGIMWGVPKYKIYKQDLNGQAQLREATWTKKIKIEEAKARKESEVLNAESEIERAKGVAKATQLIGESLRENEQYLRYLWILGLQDGKSEVIYIPTEANLPILESTRNLEKKLNEYVK